jgi:hypothetical protein
MLSDKVLADAGFWLYCSEYADEFEQHGGSFGAGAEITHCVDRLDDDKYIPIMRKYVEKLEKGWKRPVHEVFSLMGLEDDFDLADALYYTLMACVGHGISLHDKFPEEVDKYREVTGEVLDVSPIHTELTELEELASENLETPDEEWVVYNVETGETVEGFEYGRYNSCQSGQGCVGKDRG